MNDVAELAGVSISSVPHVIYKTRRVEEVTKGKIIHAIQLLNYTPNLLARSLRCKGTNLLGVIISESLPKEPACRDIGRPFGSRIFTMKH